MLFILSFKCSILSFVAFGFVATSMFLGNILGPDINFLQGGQQSPDLLAVRPLALSTGSTLSTLLTAFNSRHLQTLPPEGKPSRTLNNAPAPAVAVAPAPAPAPATAPVPAFSPAPAPAFSPAPAPAPL